MSTGRKIASSLLLIGFLLIPVISFGQEVVKYPTKPITFIVNVGPGGGGDITCRILSKIAEGILGQPIVVENKVGGAGVIGINLVAKAKPDGYTIGRVTYSPTIIIPYIRDVPYKTKEDFSFIVQCAIYAHAFVVRSDAPWKTFNDFIEDAGKNPGKRTYSTQGTKSVNHINIELIAQKANVKLRHIPYASDAEGITAVLGGHVDAGYMAAAAPYLKRGDLRALAVDTRERWKILPSVQTFREIGYRIVEETFLGVAGPKGIPNEILQKLENAFETAAKDPSFHETLERIHMVPSYLSGEELKKVIFRDYDTIGEVLKKLPLD